MISLFVHTLLLLKLYCVRFPSSPPSFPSCTWRQDSLHLNTSQQTQILPPLTSQAVQVPTP